MLKNSNNVIEIHGDIHRAYEYHLQAEAMENMANLYQKDAKTYLNIQYDMEDARDHILDKIAEEAGRVTKVYYDDIQSHFRNVFRKTSYYNKIANIPIQLIDESDTILCYDKTDRTWCSKHYTEDGYPYYEPIELMNKGPWVAKTFLDEVMEDC